MQVWSIRPISTIIDLLRHGDTMGGTRFRGSTDDPLTELGWTQLWTAVEQKTCSWNHIISSPLQRCADFARALGRRYAIPLTLDERLQEMHFGVWEGRSAGELMVTDADALQQFWTDPEGYTPPGAESLTRFSARVRLAWHDIVRSYSGQKILLVTHGGVIRVLLCHIQQHPIKQLLEIEVKHAALRRIQIGAMQKPSCSAILINDL